MTITKEITSALSSGFDQQQVHESLLEIASKYDGKIKVLKNTISVHRAKIENPNADIIKKACVTLRNHLQRNKSAYLFYSSTTNNVRCASRKQETIDNLMKSECYELLGVYTGPLDKTLVSTDLEFAISQRT